MDLRPDDATARQVAAADPARSTWLAANAGSGKTRVLTDRVARLLLDGVPPENILCLTYTKAAAGEMQNRLFAQLGDWAMKPDAELGQALAAKGVAGEMSPERLDAARRLFAQAIETPGGLKIQTIHAFCGSLLRRFPLEAGVPPTFSELDERSATALADEVLEELADGSGSGAVDALARHVSGDETLAKLVREVLSRRAAFERPFDLAAACAAHGLPPGYDEAALLAEVFTGAEDDLITTVLPVLTAKGGNDLKAAERLARVAENLENRACLEVLEDVLLTGGTAAAPFTAKRGSFPTKASRAQLGPATVADIDDLMERVEAARPRRVALASAEKTAALHLFASVFLPAMAARKAARGVLDFDDLVLKTRTLLDNPAVGDWVLWKLDGGIDHILVDEAQDTSPVQWDLIRLLAREITAGASARSDTDRTIFVVGDRKQSIYSFQGADPDAFDHLRRDFDAALAGRGGLASRELQHSFRSAPAILAAVDATFDGTAGAGIGGAPVHLAFKDALPGRVDLWPWVAREKDDAERDWTDPVDRISPQSAEARLADAIAGELRRLIDSGETIPDGTGGRRLLTEGDVLILVQRRAVLFREIIRACKARKLAIAGADRLNLTRDLAVQDLLALLAFLALPEDDLSLACALRSPLFGWSEDDLYRLAQPRSGYLWAELRTRAGDSPAHAMLADLRDQADFRRPYDLLERILTRNRGRERLIARLGPDCEEAVDALLAEALAYEQAEVPSLTGFLEWIRADDVEIKRQAERAGGRLRVMTVHGAKGLEAPLVILPDCGTRRDAQPGEVLVTAEGWAAWKTAAEATAPPVAAAKADWQAGQTAERQRLLYVAMTRAEVWLWICAAGDDSKADASWHRQIESGLVRAGATELEYPTGPGLRLASGDWTGPPQVRIPAAPSMHAFLPEWATAAAPAAGDVPEPLRPSDLGGAKALPGEAGFDEATALDRGSRLHLLLEHLPALPKAGWRAAAADLLGAPDDLLDEAEHADLFDEAVGVLTRPDLAHLFAPATLAEVDLTAPLPGGGRIHGKVDRLIVTASQVLAVDFKSNRVVPATPDETPDGLLRQMGAYASALKAIYPERRVATALLWTRTGQLMALPDSLVMAALQRAGAA
ncbi:MAG: double-strand break repair helicase AddA [Rhodobacteraceae bacterium]|nr:double-strand break repair helicase AddA [Paracoccaceae bacterium]